MEDKTKLNIYQRMWGITSEVDFVEKEYKKGMNYKIVSELAILSAIKPLLVKWRVHYYPIECTQEPSPSNISMRVKTVVRFVNIDNPTEYIDVVAWGDGADKGDDKAPGKAITYAIRYAIMKAFSIPTGDDPDQWDGKAEEKQPKAEPKPKQVNPHFVPPANTQLPFGGDETRQQLLKKAEQLGCNMHGIANYYYGKGEIAFASVDLLDEEQLKNAINMKEVEIARKGK